MTVQAFTHTISSSAAQENHVFWHVKKSTTGNKQQVHLVMIIFVRHHGENLPSIQYVALLRSKALDATIESVLFSMALGARCETGEESRSDVSLLSVQDWAVLVSGRPRSGF